MSVSPSDITPFRTSFGRNLLREVPNFAAPPYLVVTMGDLWPQFQNNFPAKTDTYFVRSMDRNQLEKDLAELSGYSAFIGLGGGQAIDAAKYFSWQLNRPLHQFPTSISVDAMFGHRSGVRENGAVRYVGWAVPECVYFDYDIIESAPPHVNRAGIGDVLCFFTGVWDWQYAENQGRCEQQWPYDPELSAHSLQLAEALLENIDDVRNMSPKGISLIVDAFKWGGASYHATGWCPRHIEGVEHYFYYALEAHTGKKFLHGQAVCLGVVAGALMHDRRTEELREAIGHAGLDITPESMGISWSEVEATLTGLKNYVQESDLPYGIANEFNVDEEFLGQLRKLVSGS